MDRNSNEINLGTNLKLDFIFFSHFLLHFLFPPFFLFLFIFSLSLLRCRFFHFDFFFLFLMITIRIISLYDKERTYTTFSCCCFLTTTYITSIIFLVVTKAGTRMMKERNSNVYHDTFPHKNLSFHTFFSHFFLCRLSFSFISFLSIFVLLESSKSSLFSSLHKNRFLEEISFHFDRKKKWREKEGEKKKWKKKEGERKKPHHWERKQFAFFSIISFWIKSEKTNKITSSSFPSSLLFLSKITELTSIEEKDSKKRVLSDREKEEERYSESNSNDWDRQKISWGWKSEKTSETRRRVRRKR